jgi:hypothetical protein
MVFNATFNTISVILWHAVLLGEETEENHWQTSSCNVVSSTPCHERDSNSTIVVIGTDSISSCKSNYHTITAPKLDWDDILIIHVIHYNELLNVSSKWIFEKNKMQRMKKPYWWAKLTGIWLWRQYWLDFGYKAIIRSKTDLGCGFKTILRSKTDLCCRYKAILHKIDWGVKQTRVLAI